MRRNISPASLPHIPKKSLGAVCCILSATLFGTMPLLAKIAYEHGSNAYTVAFGRYLFGSIMRFAMLRICLLQNLYILADEAAVAVVIDSRAFSTFRGAESSNQAPDGDTLGRFRHLCGVALDLTR